jgi:hypothetical protein
MGYSVYYILWAFAYVACGLLGFLPPTNTAILILLVLAGILFFVPPTLLLIRAVKDRNRRVVSLIRTLSFSWLVCALILIVSNILSVGASAVTGTILYYTLILLASPMVCGQIWVLSLFLMACLMITSHQQLRKMK